MRTLVRAAMILTLAGSAAALGACFIESAKPSTFRFTCSASDECSDGEVCADGLCQQPCGANMEACAGSTICINGFCSSLCPTNEDVCPAPQECVSLTPEEADGGDDAGGSGICTVLCDDDEHPCDEGQLCVVGFCATLCMSADDCAAGEECLEVGPGLSVCTPSGGGGGGFP